MRHYRIKIEVPTGSWIQQSDSAHVMELMSRYSSVKWENGKLACYSPHRKKWYRLTFLDDPLAAGIFYHMAKEKGR